MQPNKHLLNVHLWREASSLYALRPQGMEQKILQEDTGRGRGTGVGPLG